MEMAILDLLLGFVGSAKGAFAGFLLALMAFFGVIFKARRSGRLAERADVQAKESKGVEIAKNVEAKVKSQPVEVNKDKLKKW